MTTFTHEKLGDGVSSSPDSLPWLKNWVPPYSSYAGHNYAGVSVSWLPRCYWFLVISVSNQNPAGVRFTLKPFPPACLFLVPLPFLGCRSAALESVVQCSPHSDGLGGSHPPRRSHGEGSAKVKECILQMELPWRWGGCCTCLALPQWCHLRSLLFNPPAEGHRFSLQMGLLTCVLDPLCWAFPLLCHMGSLPNKGTQGTIRGRKGQKSPEQ